jgi:hypothetical protein
MIRGISLVDLPRDLESVQAVALGERDVLVFTMLSKASAAELEAIEKLVSFAWPGRKAIVLDGGARLQVVEGI